MKKASLSSNTTCHYLSVDRIDVLSRLFLMRKGDAQGLCPDPLHLIGAGYPGQDCWRDCRSRRAWRVRSHRQKWTLRGGHLLEPDFLDLAVSCLVDGGGTDLPASWEAGDELLIEDGVSADRPAH